MWRLILVLSVAVCKLASTLPVGLLPQTDGRIVGGQPTLISNYPWQVSLQRSGSHFCGGALYSKRLIITAAHCLQGLNITTLKVRAGSTTFNDDGILVDAVAYYAHKEYSPITMKNDVGLVLIGARLTFSPTIQSIKLTEKSPPHGAPAVVTGWGTTYFGADFLPRILQYIDVDIVSREICGSSRFKYGSKIKETMICAFAKGKDSCQGDSGGPLVSSGRLVGIVSWGQGCASPDYPGVYADVAELRDWIVENAAWMDTPLFTV